MKKSESEKDGQCAQNPFTSRDNCKNCEKRKDDCEHCIKNCIWTEP